MRNVLITGGTGSLGRALVRQLLDEGVPRICVLSRDEAKHAALQAELDDDRLRYFIGDVRDKDRLRLAMRGVDTVVHAAALKRIDLLEYNPLEAVRTNVMGSANVIEAALWSGTVGRCVLISSDKATAPVNAYGASKLCAEKLFLAANSYAGPTFAAVRYGNVAGSRGSVLPMWRAARERGRTPAITHLDMTRYWIDMGEAVQTVRWALQHGPQVVVPKLPSFRITDLWCAFTGYDDPSCAPVTGPRPGEKLHESLVSIDEAPETTDAGDYYLIRGDGLPVSWDSYSSDRNELWLSRQELSARIEALG